MMYTEKWECRACENPCRIEMDYETEPGKARFATSTGCLCFREAKNANWKRTDNPAYTTGLRPGQSVRVEPLGDGSFRIIRKGA